MNLTTIIALLTGLVSGSFITYKITSSKVSENFAAAQKEVAECEVRPQAEQKVSSNSTSSIVTAPQIPAASSNNAKMQSQDTSACLDHMKPSDMAEWDIKWKKRVQDFLSSNPSFWNSKGNHSFDSRVIPSIRGKYAGNWRHPERPHAQIQFGLEISSDTKGLLNLDIIQKESAGGDGSSTSCSQDLVPRQEVGLNENENAVHFFWYNCSPQILGTSFAQFVIKVPMGMSKGQQKRLDVYGLDENFEWKSIGFMDLVKK